MYKLHSIFYKCIFYCCDQIPDKGWLLWRNDWFLAIGQDFKDCVWRAMSVEVGAWSLLDGSASKGKGILCSAVSCLVSAMFSPGHELTEWFKCPSNWIFYPHGHLRWAIQACPEGCLLGNSTSSRLTLIYNQLTLQSKMWKKKKKKKENPELGFAKAHYNDYNDSLQSEIHSVDHIKISVFRLFFDD